MQIAVTGAKGQMGGNVIQAAREKGHSISVAVDREKGERNGLKVRNDNNLEEILQDKEVDVIIDFSAPEATIKYIKTAKKLNIPIVIGTTGFSEEEEKKLEKAGQEIPVLKAANFSPSINLMQELVKEAAKKLEDYDIEVTETHHNRKRDAPSGTANVFLNVIKEARGNFDDVHGRKGEAPRKKEEIGVHAKRAGNIRGVHEVLLAGEDEVLKIKHRSESRKVFASGALKAAERLAERPPGFYTFSEVLEG